jgi:hypothetical protein
MMKSFPNLKTWINKMLVMKNILIVLIAFSMIACEKVIEPKDLPEQDLRIVLNSILDTDSNFTAHISSSKNIVSGKDHLLLENATCSVYENNVFVEDLKPQGKGKYRGAKKPSAGNTYKFVVNSPGYEQVEATTRLPAPVTVKSISALDTARYPFRTNELQPHYKYIMGQYKFQLIIADKPDEINNYNVVAVAQGFSNGTAITTSLNPSIHWENQPNNQFIQYYNPNVQINDKSPVNGNEIIVRLNASIYCDLFNNPEPDSISLQIVVQNINEDFVKYQTTATEQQYTRTGLFAEPVFVYSNTSNGVGILAGSSGSKHPIIAARVIKY